MSKNILLSVFASLFLGACASSLSPSYKQKTISPVKATVNQKRDVLTIEYPILMENSAHWPAGVNYQIKDNEIHIAIKGCFAKSKCEPMVKGQYASSALSQKVMLPYHGEKIVLIYKDATERFFPE